MESLKLRLKQFSQRLDDDTEYEMSDEMQNEYWALKEELEMLGDLELLDKFDELCERYETPENIIDGILKDMYPDTDGEFDLDEWD